MVREKYNFILAGITVLFLFAPFFAFAQFVPPPPALPPLSDGGGSSCTASADNPIVEILEGLICLLDVLIPIAAGLAVLFFFWGLALFILAAGDEEKRTKQKAILIWGIIIMFVVASLWGLVAFLQEVFSITGNEQVEIPSLLPPG